MDGVRGRSNRGQHYANIDRISIWSVARRQRHAVRRRLQHHRTWGLAASMLAVFSAPAKRLCGQSVPGVRLRRKDRRGQMRRMRILDAGDRAHKSLRSPAGFSTQASSMKRLDFPLSAVAFLLVCGLWIISIATTGWLVSPQTVIIQLSSGGISFLYGGSPSAWTQMGPAGVSWFASTSPTRWLPEHAVLPTTWTLLFVPLWPLVVLFAVPAGAAILRKLRRPDSSPPSTNKAS